MQQRGIVREIRSGKTWKTRVMSTGKIAGKGDKEANSTDTLTVCDGEHEWRQTAVKEKVMVFRSKATVPDPLSVLREAARAGQLRVTGHEHIVRQPCVVFEARGERTRGQPKATYWVSEAHGVILRSKIIRGSGSEVEVITSEFQVNEPIEDDKLAYTPPDGATVIEVDAIGGQPDKPPKP